MTRFLWRFLESEKYGDIMRKTKIKKITSSKLKINHQIKPRVLIPVKLRRELLVECGHKCTIHNCSIMQNLEAHHINSKPSDNRIDNLIMLCPTHHTMADRGIIDRTSCKMYKAKLESQQTTKAEQILENTEFIKNELKQIKKPKKSRNTTKRRQRK